MPAPTVKRDVMKRKLLTALVIFLAAVLALCVAFLFALKNAQEAIEETKPTDETTQGLRETQDVTTEPLRQTQSTETSVPTVQTFPMETSVPTVVTTVSTMPQETESTELLPTENAEVPEETEGYDPDELPIVPNG